MKVSEFHDSYFVVKAIASTPNPHQVVYAAMHQDYGEDYVGFNLPVINQKASAGELVVKHLLSGNKGHFGPLEHPQITFATGYFPHSVMQQARTHRVGTSFDCQSMRYTSKRILQAAKGEIDIESVVYLRPLGEYRDRNGTHYNYDEEWRQRDLEVVHTQVNHYAQSIEWGMSEEHARGLLCFDYRQHFVVSFNARSLMHFLDLRAKPDAQLEIQVLAKMMLAEFKLWMPEVSEWYEKSRLNRGMLAP